MRPRGVPRARTVTRTATAVALTGQFIGGALGSTGRDTLTDTARLADDVTVRRPTDPAGHDTPRPSTTPAIQIAVRGVVGRSEKDGCAAFAACGFVKLPADPAGVPRTVPGGSGTSWGGDGP